MITVQCPHCDEFVPRADESLGQYDDCPDCGELFVALSAAEPDVYFEAAPSPERSAVNAAADFSLPASQATDATETFDDEVVSRSTNTRDLEDQDPVEIPSDAPWSADEPQELLDSEILIEVAPLETGDEDDAAHSIRDRMRELLKSKQSRSYVVSAAAHAVLLLILAAWILPQLPDRSAFLTLLPETALADPIETIEFAADPDNMAPETLPDPTPLAFIQPETTVSEPEIKAPGSDKLTTTEDDTGKVPESESTSAGDRNSPAAVQQRASTNISQARTVEGASDAVVESIRGKLMEKDTVVVWLMDRSISMDRQRELLANRVGEFLETVHADETGKFHELMHIVVAFGAAPEKLMVTVDPNKALVAMRRKYATDPSGQENVFTAVEWSAEQFIAKNGTTRSKHLMFVVNTDESGDDYLRMERAIAACRKFGIEVSVIGPSAVLGQMRGYHSFTASDNRLYYLPVVRGPDTALPQRLKLPYWFRGVPASWDEKSRGPWQGKAPAWQGGSNMDAMISGFGPYALTRLTLATGGDYIVYDRPADRSPFRMDELRPYLPDYRSPNQIQAALHDHPLRMALLKMVTETHRLNLTSPRTDFGVQFGGSFYLTPAQFRGQLSGQLKQEQQRALQAAAAIQQVLANVENRVVDGLRDAETSPRWQAWHDLTVGRLHAGRIRFLVYADFVSRLSPGQLKAESNGLSLSPTKLPRTSELIAAAEQARQLLERCRNEHRGTPWEILADRELMHQFGLRTRERTVPAARRPTGRPPRTVSLPRL